MTILETAVEYHKAGLQPIPLHPKSKVPVHKMWQQWSEKRMTRPELVKIFSANPEYGIGIVTGYASGVMVVDLDVKHAVDDPEEYMKALEGAKEWVDAANSPLVAMTGTNGYHVFYKYVSGTKNRTDIFRDKPRAYKVDIRSERGFVVAAPSIHDTTGQVYRWVKKDIEMHISTRKLVRPPKEIIQASYEAPGAARSPKDWERRFELKGIGVRHTTFVEIVGSLLARYEPPLWEPFCWPLVMAWNKVYAKPALEEFECKKNFIGLADAEMKKRQSYVAK